MFKVASRLQSIVPFSYGFRPFFLLAGWFAVVSIGVWLWFYGAGRLLLPAFPPHYWHGHEMLFGFVTAAIAGFLLTAVPSWTGSRGFAGAPLMALTLVWLLGRVAFMAAGTLPFPLVAAVELAFLPLLAGLIAPALLRSTNRNTPMLAVLLVFWLCDATFLYALYTADPPLARLSLLLALDVVLVLITVIGGRIVPAFTGNALRKSGLDVQMPRRPGLERFVIAARVAVSAGVFPSARIASGIPRRRSRAASNRPAAVVAYPASRDSASVTPISPASRASSVSRMAVCPR